MVASVTVPVTVRPTTEVEVALLVEPLFREYGEWVAQRLHQGHGVVLTEADLDGYHQAFRAEIPKLLGPRGRLVIAVLGDQPVGVGAFKPVDDCTAEVKRMYVRPEAQGRRVGRAVLERLLTDARSAGYTDVRLETLDVMTAARALYTSLGFVETSEFPGSETAGGPLSPFMRYLHLSLTTPPARGRLVRRR